VFSHDYNCACSDPRSGRSKRFKSSTASEMTPCSRSNVSSRSRSASSLSVCGTDDAAAFESSESGNGRSSFFKSVRDESGVSRGFPGAIGPEVETAGLSLLSGSFSFPLPLLGVDSSVVPLAASEGISVAVGAEAGVGTVSVDPPNLRSAASRTALRGSSGSIAAVFWFESAPSWLETFSAAPSSAAATVPSLFSAEAVEGEGAPERTNSVRTAVEPLAAEVDALSVVEGAAGFRTGTSVVLFSTGSSPGRGGAHVDRSTAPPACARGRTTSLDVPPARRAPRSPVALSPPKLDSNRISSSAIGMRSSSADGVVAIPRGRGVAVENSPERPETVVWSARLWSASVRTRSRPLRSASSPPSTVQASASRVARLCAEAVPVPELAAREDELGP